MKVICPECAESFDVPEEALGAHGRRVRCAACRHVWLQEPVHEAPFDNFRRMEETMEVEPIPASLHPDAEDAAGEPARPRMALPAALQGIELRYLGRMLAGFALGVLLLGGALAGLAVAGVAPSFYISRGLMSPHVEPLRIIDMSLIETKIGDVALTIVSGRLVNTSAEPQPVPPLDFIPVDAAGVEAEGLRIKSNKTMLQPKESMEFKAQLQGTAPEGGQVRVVLAR